MNLKWFDPVSPVRLPSTHQQLQYAGLQAAGAANTCLISVDTISWSEATVPYDGY